MKGLIVLGLLGLMLIYSISGVFVVSPWDADVNRDCKVDLSEVVSVLHSEASVEYKREVITLWRTRAESPRCIVSIL